MMLGGERAKLWCRTSKRKKRPSPDICNYTFDDVKKRPKFGSRCEQDEILLDAYSKAAALRACPSVVGLSSSTGGEEPVFLCGGTIIACDFRDGRYFGTIITSATLLRGRTGTQVLDDIKVTVYLQDGKRRKGKIVACDLHYNLALIESKSKSLLPTAILRHLDISISLDPNEVHNHQKSWQLKPHQHLFKLTPGDRVIALGRYFIKPYRLMASPGQFSIDHTEYECKELLRATCKITQCGVGGPLINCHGEVIGINFYSEMYTPFTPINIVSKWWEHFKTYGEFSRPSHGMEVTNIFNAEVKFLEKTIQQFPHVFKGVIVEEVTLKSSADATGIKIDDVIVKCDGKTVHSDLEFFEIMLDKAGKTVVLEVIRENGGTLQLSMVVCETLPAQFYCWRLQSERVFAVIVDRGLPPQISLLD